MFVLVFRYCIFSREITDSDVTICALTKKSVTKTQCISHMQRPPLVKFLFYVFHFKYFFIKIFFDSRPTYHTFKKSKYEK